MPRTRSNPLSYLSDQLQEFKQKGTYFRLRILEDEQAAECTFDGKKVINLASNNYLGLTTHPKLREAALDVGADSAVLVSGDACPACAARPAAVRSATDKTLIMELFS